MVNGERGSTGRSVFKAARRPASLNKTPVMRKRRSTSRTEESEKVAERSVSGRAELKCRLIVQTCSLSNTLYRPCCVLKILDKARLSERLRNEIDNCIYSELIKLFLIS